MRVRLSAALSCREPEPRPHQHRQRQPDSPHRELPEVIGEGKTSVVLAGVGEVDDTADHLALLIGGGGIVGEVEDGVGLSNGEGQELRRRRLCPAFGGRA